MTHSSNHTVMINRYVALIVLIVPAIRHQCGHKGQS